MALGWAGFFAHHFQAIAMFRATVAVVASVPRGHEQHVPTLPDFSKKLFGNS
jgi:hypothetical protein